MKLARILVCSLVLMAAANAARATVMFFTDRAAFESAIAATSTVDFESSFPDTNITLTFGDATFVSTDGSGLHRTDAGMFGNPTTTLAAQNFGGIRIELASGHFAIGLDVGELFGSAGGQFTLTGGGDALLDSRTTTVGHFGNSPSFVGWLSSDEIGSLEIVFGEQGAFETIDNVTLGVAAGPSAGQAPEPASLALLGLGLVGMGLARRRRAG